MPINVIPGEISPFTIAIAIISGFILLFGYISMFLKERLFLSEACKNKNRQRQERLPSTPIKTTTE
jgi:hypothetical protein